MTKIVTFSRWDASKDGMTIGNEGNVMKEVSKNMRSGLFNEGTERCSRHRRAEMDEEVVAFRAKADANSCDNRFSTMADPIGSTGTWFSDEEE